MMNYAGVRVLTSHLGTIEPEPGVAFVVPVNDREWGRVTNGMLVFIMKQPNSLIIGADIEANLNPQSVFRHAARQLLDDPKMCKQAREHSAILV